MRNENSLLYYIWLTECCGYNAGLAWKLLNKFKTPEEVYKANLYDKDLRKLIGLKNILKMDRSLESAKRILYKCQKGEISLITVDDGSYPKRMREVENPPLLLYTKGNLPDLNRILGISIVGSRHCSDDGRKAAEMLGRELADAGFAVISGMALGIDGAAHCGAISVGGTTVAVLAGGADRIYPTEHAKLYGHILEHGGVVTERPPGVVGQRYFYRQRNRIMVGLSAGVIVVEGSQKSGTSITARLAASWNRDVFAVPGNPVAENSELPNGLIADGAKFTTSSMDVIEEYIDIYPEELEYGLSIKGRPVVGNVAALVHSSEDKPKIENITPSVNDRQRIADIDGFLKTSAFNDTECKILKYLFEADEESLFDDIAENCGIEASALSSTLIILQMKKAVIQSAGSRYSFNPDIVKV